MQWGFLDDGDTRYQFKCYQNFLQTIIIKVITIGVQTLTR